MNNLVAPCSVLPLYVSKSSSSSVLIREIGFLVSMVLRHHGQYYRLDLRSCISGTTTLPKNMISYFLDCAYGIVFCVNRLGEFQKTINKLSYCDGFQI